LVCSCRFAPAFQYSAPPSDLTLFYSQEAFGHKFALIEGYLSWLSGVTDNSLYPVLFLKYTLSDLEKEDYEGDGGIDLYSYNFLTRWLMLTTMIVLLGIINYRGITIVSTTALIVCVLSMMPFFVLAAVCIPKVDPSRWTVVPEGPNFGLGKVDWSSFLNILFWNLNYWDSASIFSGDVKVRREGGGGGGSKDGRSKVTTYTANAKKLTTFCSSLLAHCRILPRRTRGHSLTPSSW